MLVGFAVLGWLGWKSVSQDTEMVRRLSVVEQRLDSVIKILPAVYQPPSAESGDGQDLIAPSFCDRECVSQLVNEAVATISGISQPAKQEVIERVVEKVTTVQISQPRTQYVSLGGGGTTDTNWVDLAGSGISFDISDFGNIDQIYFEAQLQSPAGRVFSRLWDKNANNIVYGSEISHVAGDAKLVSSPVSIRSGGRTIIVQLKSETQQPVKVLSSRLRVDTR